MKYKAIYKCQICNTLVQYGESKEIPYDELPILLGKVIQNQQFINNAYLYQAPMYTVHQCKDGNCGLAYFAGFMKE